MYNVKNREAYQTAMQLSAKGVSNKEIALRLRKTEKTVGKWINNSPQQRAVKALAILQNRLLNEAETLKAYEVEKLTRSIKNIHVIANPYGSTVLKTS